MSRTDGGWDVVLAPRLMPRIACAAAVLIAAVGITVGFFYNLRYTGAIILPADQVAVAGLGVVLGGSLLLLTRPRIRVGPAGIGVRNLLGYRLIPWSEVVGVSFPAGSRWARVDLAHHEYVPVLAIQAVDGERAVAAMDTVRALADSYRPVT